MSDVFANLSQKIQNVSSQFAKDGKKYLQSVLSQGEKIGQKGKVQIEIEKLKWELKQKFKELGIYVADKKISKSVTDFSHDHHFLDLINEVNKIELYVNELQKERDNRDIKLARRV